MTTNQICYLLSQKLVITHYRKRTQALFYICDYKKNVSEKTEIMKKKKNKKTTKKTKQQQQPIYCCDRIDCLINHDIGQSHPSAGLLYSPSS